MLFQKNLILLAKSDKIKNLEKSKNPKIKNQKLKNQIFENQEEEN